MKNNFYLNFDFYIFDCDGVILDSNDFKNKIFLASLNKYSYKEKQIFKKYIKNNQGISRYNLYSYFFKKIIKLNKSSIKREYITALRYYDNELKERYFKCKFVPGFIKFIRKINNKKKIFVLSGSNQKELKKIFMKKNIIKCFDNIYGSPKNKEENLLLIEKKIKSNSRGIYFGDSYYDYRVSKNIKSEFVFIYGYSHDKKLKQLKSINRYKDFTKIY